MEIQLLFFGITTDLVGKNSILYSLRDNTTVDQLKNILMAIIAAVKSNIDIKKIFKVMPKIRSVEGRFERVGKIKNKSKIIEQEIYKNFSVY